MSHILGTWRFFAQQMLVPILAVCAIAFLHHTPAGLAAQAEAAESVLEEIESQTIRTQMTVPVALGKLLPIGVMGGLCAVVFAAFISTHDTYLHSWGSIFIQDVVMPLRKKPLTPKQHLMLLRCSIAGVAIFIFCFSLLFRQTDYIRMFFVITGAIYLSGAGTCIVGGLYWKRGKTAAAWGAMIFGALVAVTAIMSQQIVEVDAKSWAVIVWLRETLYQSAIVEAWVEYVGSISGQVMSFYAAMTSLAVYVLVSLLGGRKVFNLDRMLHRGAYAVKSDTAEGQAGASAGWEWLGIGKEFTRRDKALYLSSIVWIGLWAMVFIVGMIYSFARGAKDVADASWMTFWHFMVWMAITLAIITTIWLTIGGLYDLKEMFRLLRGTARDDTDDGRVRAQDKAEVEGFSVAGADNDVAN